MKNNNSSLPKMFSVISFKLFWIIFIASLLLNACSVSNKIDKNARTFLLNDSIIGSGQIGISIYEPLTGKYLYNYNAEKYFVPASNTKLFTLYAGLKYLGDSLVGLKYYESNDTIYAEATGDPTFLHPDFPNQPVLNFFKENKKTIFISDENFKDTKYGKGWAWDDYDEAFMAERNAFPLSGNTIKIIFNKQHPTNQSDSNFFRYKLEIVEPTIQISNIKYVVDNSYKLPFIKRNENENSFSVIFPDSNFYYKKTIPFCTNGINTTIEFLQYKFPASNIQHPTSNFQLPTSNIIKTQSTDSLLKPMMYNSDNFFAEQTLLMVSNERLGFMNDEKIIDTLLKNDLKEIPQKPRWVDGCGMSRYNLFSPKSFIFILDKMKDEFGYKRLKTLLPTGGQGTLKNYFVADSKYIFAKTGSMGNQFALSGFIETKKGNLLIFSILTNNFQGNSTIVRRKIAYFLKQIRNKY